MSDTASGTTDGVAGIKIAISISDSHLIALASGRSS
jgi:hypothetical protein